jgi:hypothetical protein
LHPTGWQLGIEHVEACEIERVGRRDQWRKHGRYGDEPEQDCSDRRTGSLNDDSAEHSFTIWS